MTEIVRLLNPAMEATNLPTNLTYEEALSSMQDQILATQATYNKSRTYGSSAQGIILLSGFLMRLLALQCWLSLAIGYPPSSMTRATMS
jgi:hypothetical protein